MIVTRQQRCDNAACKHEATHFLPCGTGPLMAAGIGLYLCEPCSVRLSMGFAVEKMRGGK